ncbi:MAG: RNase P modulator RnpM [bacterium]
MSTKHIPERTCIGCKCKKAKAELLRFVYQPWHEEIIFDPQKRLPGRGAYLCRDEKCLLRASKQRGLDRAYRVKVAKHIYQQLANVFREIIQNER